LGVKGGTQKKGGGGVMGREKSKRPEKKSKNIVKQNSPEGRRGRILPRKKGTSRKEKH